MAKDDETGIDAVATDGNPSEDELAKRRAAAEKGGSAKDRALADEQQKLDAEDGKVEVSEEDDGQLFVWEQGRKVTLGTLIARGVPVEHAFVFGGKRLKGRGQIMGFDEDAIIVGRGLVASTAVVPTRDGDEKVTKVTIETRLAMKVIMPADSDEAEGLLAGVLEKRGYRRAEVA